MLSAGPTIADAVAQSIGSGLTSAPIDRKRAVMALRVARTPSEHEAILAVVLAARARHRAWLTVTQRRWQRETRYRHSGEQLRARTVRAYAARAGGIDRAPARVRETMATRERYVRCAG